MDKSSEKKKDGCFRRIVMRLSVYGAVALFTCLVTGFIIVQSPWFKEKIRLAAQERLSRTLNISMHIGNISGNLWSDMTLEDVIVTLKEETIVKIKRLSAKYFLPALVSRTLFLNDLKMEGLFLHAVKQRDGRLNLEHIFSAPEGISPHGETGNDFRVLVRHLALKDAHIQYTEDIENNKSDLDLRISDLAAVLDMGSTIQLEIKRASFDLDPFNLRVSLFKIQAEYDPAGDAFKIMDMQICTPLSEITAKGMVNPADAGLDIAADIKSLSLEDIGSWLNIKGLKPGMINGHIHARGNLERLEHRLNISLNEITFEEQGYLRISNLDGIDIEASGSVTNLNPAVLPVNGLEQYSGDINADFNFKAGMITLPDQNAFADVTLRQSELLGHSIREGFVYLYLRGSDVTVKDIRLETSAGSVAGNLSIAGLMGPSESKDLLLDLVFSNFDPDMFVPRIVMEGSLNMGIHAEASFPDSMDLSRTRAHITAELEPSRIMDLDISRMILETDIRDGVIILDRFRLDTCLGSLSAEGVVETGSQSCDILAEIEVPDIGKTVDYAAHDKAAVTGRIKASARLAGWLDHPVFTARITGDKLVYEDISTEQIRINGKWEGLPASFRVEADASIDSLSFKGSVFSSVDIQSILDTNSASAYITARHVGGEQAMVKGRIDGWARPEKSIFVSDLSVQTKNMHLINQEPVKLTLSQGMINIESFSLSSDTALLSVRGEAAAAGSQDLKVLLRDLDVRQVAWLFPDVPEISGMISADVTLAGTSENPFLQGSITVKNGEAWDFPFSELNTDFRYESSKAEVHAALFQRDNSAIRINGTLLCTLSLVPFSFTPHRDGLSMILEAKSLDIAGAGLPIKRDFGAGGFLDLHVNASGNMMAPQLQGHLNFKDGMLHIKSQKIRLDNIDGNVIFTPSDIQILDIHGNDGTGGAFSLKGVVKLKDFYPDLIDLQAKGSDLSFPFHSAVYAKYHPDISVSGSLSDLRIEGEILISEGRIDLDRFIEQGPSDIKVIADADDGEDAIEYSEEAGGPDPVNRLASNVTVIIPRNVWLRGQGANVEIAGSLNMLKEPEKPFILVGSMSAVRGTYIFQGKQFSVIKGDLTFLGLQELNPNLDIEAETLIRDVRIIVNIGGTAKDIRLTLSSEPYMEQIDIVSYLMFGQPSSRLGRGEATSAEQVALGITGQIAADEINRIFGDSLKVDTFYIDAGDGKLSSASVSIGKYITPEIFAAYKQGFKVDEIHELEITYEINKNWSVRTQFGNEKTTGIDLLWEYDF